MREERNDLKLERPKLSNRLKSALCISQGKKIERTRKTQGDVGANKKWTLAQTNSRQKLN